MTTWDDDGVVNTNLPYGGGFENPPITVKKRIGRRNGRTARLRLGFCPTTGSSPA